MVNVYGGGANTNLTGLRFERETSLNDALISAGYCVKDHIIYDINHNFIGLSVPGYSFYKTFLEKEYINIKMNDIYLGPRIDYSKINSKRWKPDDVFVNYTNRTVYIIEKKYQKQDGSVDEKLPNCEFKKWEYEKLCEPKNYNVEFIYVLSDWYLQDKYRDMLFYIEHKKCQYCFNNIPLEYLGLRR